MEGNGSQLPCLDPKAGREGQGGLCPTPIVQGHEPSDNGESLSDDFGTHSSGARVCTGGDFDVEL